MRFLHSRLLILRWLWGQSRAPSLQRWRTTQMIVSLTQRTDGRKSLSTQTCHAISSSLSDGKAWFFDTNLFLDWWKKCARARTQKCSVGNHMNCSGQTPMIPMPQRFACITKCIIHLTLLPNTSRFSCSLAPTWILMSKLWSLSCHLWMVHTSLHLAMPLHGLGIWHLECNQNMIEERQVGMLCTTLFISQRFTHIFAL